ncbi:MAG: acyl-CoA thioesterase FadM [Myxococcota bacterium]
MDERIDLVELALPREAASPRRVGRPAAIWRLFQEAAVQSSSRRGWSPQRYSEAGIGFVLAQMTALHTREIGYGQPIQAKTWVRSFRRRIISDRELRLSCNNEPVASASQRWVHVSAALKLQPASPEFVASFPLHDPLDDPSAVLPELPPASGSEHRLSFPCWNAWLDPLGHVNHPTYLEWCDEHTGRLLAAAGVSPALLQPVAEHIHYRAGVGGGDTVLLRTSLVGATADGRTVTLRHEIEDPSSGRAYARARTIRRLADGRALAPLLR